MVEEVDRDILEVLDSLVYVEVVWEPFYYTFISSWDNQYSMFFRNEMLEEGDYDIIELFDSVVIVEVIEKPL